MRSQTSPSDGFTLLEVMVALFVVAGLLMAVMHSVNTSLVLADTSEARTVGTLLAMGKLDEVTGTESGSGKFEDPFSDYSYSIGVSQTEYPGIYIATVSVWRGPDRVEMKKMLRGTN